MAGKHARLLGALAGTLAVTLLVLAAAQAATYRQGSTGAEVRTIQDKLKRWGYYDGQVDGIFGEATRRAVVKFQKKNGLQSDGIVGTNTLRALGMSVSGGGGGGAGSASGEHDVALLARVISAEARGEPYAGQVAVGAVILNRIEHPSFPSTLAGVVYQPGAFSCMDDGQIDQPVAESARRAAQEALNGSDPSGGAIYYFNPATATSAWIWSRPLIKVIGRHRFCS